MHPLTKAALEYVEAGLHVLALHHKRPNARFHRQWSWENSIRGRQTIHRRDHPADAALYDGCRGCDDLRAFAEIFEHPSTTGVAILIPPHVLVADVDSEDAAMLFIGLTGKLPDTAVARTVNGLHIWYHSPGATGSFWLGGSTLLWKGFGSYVCAPPSRHFTEQGVEDGTYVWLNPLVVDGMIRGIEYLPDRIDAHVQSMRAAAVTAPGRAVERGHSLMRPVAPGAEPMVVIGSVGFAPDYSIDGLMRAIAEAPDGKQNSIIAWAAMVAQESGVPYDVAMEKLMQAAIEGHHPVPRARATIRGVYKRRAAHA